MTMFLGELGKKAGVTWFDYQVDAFASALSQIGMQRMCLYYKTGAGKTITSLAIMHLWHQRHVLVVAPPSTHSSWEEWAPKLGLEVTCVSHAKFRQKQFKVNRDQAIIVDEFHLLGKNTGQGWKKMDTMARHLQGPLLILSATPNYNDAERCYCIQHVLDPQSCKGGMLEFLYTHCKTEQDPFSMTPKVLGFHLYRDAANYLASLPYVQYLPDDLVYTITEVPFFIAQPPELITYGLNRRKDRIIASIIEEKHALVDWNLVLDTGFIRAVVIDEVMNIFHRHKGPLLVFANHATVAMALDRRLAKYNLKVGLVHGKTPAKKKEERISAFRDGVLDVLIGTATLATGTDGLDKVCDTLLILDDTEDDSLRRQLIGRIMPRGADADASKKNVYRLVPQ